MKKKILIIILSFFFIALLIGGGILLRNISIQRQEHIDELMQIELPDIVFSQKYINTGWNPHIYCDVIIDDKGNVYRTEDEEAVYNVHHSEGRAVFDENWTIIGHVDEIELREKYAIFLELVNMPDYRKTPDYSYVTVDEMLDIYWNGYYLEDGKRVQFQYFIFPTDAEYTVVDERGVELAEWVNEQTGLVGERRSKFLFDK